MILDGFFFFVMIDPVKLGVWDPRRLMAGASDSPAGGRILFQ